MRCLLLMLFVFSASAHAQYTRVIGSVSRAGELVFDRTSNAVSYQVQWCATACGTWVGMTNYPREGTGSITTAVPMVYRVVAVVNNPPPNMSLIPAGVFAMGDAFGEDINTNEIPLHIISISAFYIDKYEVTKALWDEVKNFNAGNGYSYSNAGEGKATNHPVHTINWFDAVKWCNARSEMEGLTPVYYTDVGLTTVYKTGEVTPLANWTANGYRLPTEAEWEKAARGGVMGRRFPWGDIITHFHANYYATPNYNIYDLNITNGYHPTFNDGSDGVWLFTSPVGYFPPNDYDLYDIAGNVLEWCWDWYGRSYYSISPSADPRGPTEEYDPGSLYRYKILRSGSWNLGAYLNRVSMRHTMWPETEYNFIGFRCARGRL